jgi:CBS domain-containing protein
MTKANLTAKDVMQRDIITVYGTDSLQEAMALMTENHVTGLPVVNSKSQCIGVITAADILNFEQEHAEEASEVNANMAQHYNPETEQWESVRVGSFALEEFGEVRVSEVMTRDLISVEQDTPIRDVAKIMVKARVHRMLVLDDNSRIYGIITSSDFVKLYAEG